MVNGDIQDAEIPRLLRSDSVPLELLVSPALDPPLQLPYLDALALSATNIASTAWDLEVKKIAIAIYDQALWVRGLFGALDGLIISYSTFKYIFDYITPEDTSSSDAMHDWMVTGGGAIGACTGSLAIITLSLFGTLFDDDDKNPLIRSMAMIWPYVRDGFKGLKFAYKGVRSTVQMAQVMGLDMRSIIFPLGLVLGVAACFNRIWYRNQVTEKRKLYQKFNNVLLKRAQNLGGAIDYDLEDDTGIVDDAVQLRTLYLKINEADGILEYKLRDPAGELVQGKLSIKNDLDFKYLNAQGEAIPLTLDALKTRYHKKILEAANKNGHTEIVNNEENRKFIRDAIKHAKLLHDRRVVVASALFAGFIDGLYTYMGALGLAILSPQLFVAIAVCCLIFTVICVINRYYEEDQYQNEFLRSAKNVELVLAAQDIEDSFSKLQILSMENALNSPQYNEDTKNLKLADSPAICEFKRLDTDITKLQTLLDDVHVIAFETRKKEWDEIYAVSTGRAILMGLRSGLYFYSAASSIIFAYAAFCTTFPPALLVTAIAVGIISLIAFVIHAVIVHAGHTDKVNKNKDKRDSDIKLVTYVSDIKAKIQNGQEITPASVEEQDALMDGMPMVPVPQLDYQPKFEIIRSCCSGLPKGNKGVDFVWEYWLEPDSQGHYQETSWMMRLGVVFSIFYAIVYALRAFGKGFRGANDVPLPKLHSRELRGGASRASTPANSDFNEALSSCGSVPQRRSAAVADEERCSSPVMGYRFFGAMGEPVQSAGDLAALNISAAAGPTLAPCRNDTPIFH